MRARMGGRSNSCSNLPAGLSLGMGALVRLETVD